MSRYSKMWNGDKYVGWFANRQDAIDSAESKSKNNEGCYIESFDHCHRLVEIIERKPLSVDGERFEMSIREIKTEPASQDQHSRNWSEILFEQIFRKDQLPMEVQK